jgi:hypothetical protein
MRRQSNNTVVCAGERVVFEMLWRPISCVYASMIRYQALSVATQYSQLESSGNLNAIDRRTVTSKVDR